MVKKTRFTLIHLADFSVPKKEHLTPQTPQEEMEDIDWPIPCFAVLVQHPLLGNILYDTGVDANWQYRWPQNMKDTYPGMVTYNLREKLAQLGLGVDDIDLLILSHMHFDHAGNIRWFADTRAGKDILVAEEEAKKAFLATNMHNITENVYRMDGYLRSDINNIEGINFKLISEDTKLADDIELILLPGHTMAVMGLVVRTEKTGTVIFPSDAIYNSINYGPPVILPGLAFMPEQYGKSIEKCRKIADAENGQVFFSHDMPSFEKYKTSPNWYD